MFKSSSSVPEGSLVYIKESNSMFIRTSKGWSKLLVLSLIPCITNQAGIKVLLKIPFPLLTVAPLLSQLRMIALNFPLSGDMNGIRGADLQCYRQSQEAQLYGTFRAFLAVPTQDLTSLVKRTDRTLPVVNLKGQLLAKSWNSLFEGNNAAHFNAKKFPIYTFNGRNILKDPLWSNKMVWHGSNLRGGHVPEENCQGWQASNLTEGLASPLSQRKLLAGQRHNCSNSLVVLCSSDSQPGDTRSFGCK
uniref:Collagenase NC10/endostatin domain-containing protein n=1 Tax=Crocodylus porosus TaxID=8502 RepID=A0A7M4E475_CROPO